jgi:VWFA-related protein
MIRPGRSGGVHRALAATAGLILSLSGVFVAPLIGAQKPASGQVLTFPVATRQVQVSVVVHDKNGAPVRDLKASDFQLFDKGAEQTIESFSVELEAPVQRLAAAAPPKAPEREFNNQRGSRGGVTVILLDRLNTAWEDQKHAKDQIIKFLRQVQPNDRLGLYVLESDMVRVLHDFTSDASSILRALDRHQGGTSAEFSASEERAVETGDTEMDRFIAEGNEMITAAALKNRAASTIEALIAIANHLKAVQGRKNVVWVSSAFPLTFNDPVGRGGAPGLSTGNVFQAVRRAARALSDAGVAVYPVDARGVVGAWAQNPAGIRFTGPTNRGTIDNFTTLESVTRPLDTAKTVAEATGGRAFYGTNDIGGAIRRALDDSTVTYLLGYSPTHNEWNGRFREIKVKVKRPGVEARHRQGYMASPLLESDRMTSVRVLNQALQNPLEATGIALSVRVEPVEGTGGREVNLVIHLDARPITLERKGDRFEGAVSVVVAQSNAEGRVLKDFDSDIALKSLTREMMDRLLTEGFVLNKRVKLRDDIHRLHVVVGDPPSAAVGTVIIPAAKLRLPQE